MKPQIDIIIPTFNNTNFLIPCIRSIARTGILRDMARLIIVNNGSEKLKERINLENTTILEPGENLGWEKGLQLALKEKSDAPFVVFQNDDTVIPFANSMIYNNLLYPFSNDQVAAVGPTTTVCAGRQSIFHPATPLELTTAPFLIFFTVMLRRKALDEVGGIDTNLPGGDDFDLSIRLREKGYKLLIQPMSFLIHHGFKTGERVHGSPNKPGGWNSLEASERTNHHLIKKHGFRSFFKTLTNQDNEMPISRGTEDLEGDLVRKHIKGVDIIELGCGSTKTVANAIGVDRIQSGEKPPHINGTCVADVLADVQERLPFEELSKDTIIARHILEHCLDIVKTLNNWNNILRQNGRLIVAVPDERVTTGIPLNPEHVHAFNDTSLRSIMNACGFMEISTESCNNGVSMVGVYEKVIHMGKN